MAAAPPLPAHELSPQRHESFFAYARWRWAKRATLLGIVVIGIYLLHDPDPKPNGATWYGYTLGTIGAGLIVWLSMLGVRKRTVSRRPWSVKAWTSAHVYLGLVLAIIGTLHTGFEFGWNVHTLAYVLMILVIVSGIFGIGAYGLLPSALSANRGEQTESDMIAGLRTIDSQINDAAQGLSSRAAQLVRDALNENVFKQSLWWRLTGTQRRGPTRLARDGIDEPGADAAAMARVEALLDRRLMALAATRRHLALRARLEIWLYVHVPLTIALLAALGAHIFSVFFYW